MQVIIFQKGLYAYHWTTRKKNICILSSHRATRELYTKVPSHRAPVGALCEGSMRIELRSELYAKGALCGSTMLYIVNKYKKKVRIYKYGFDAFVNSDFYKILQSGGRVIQYFVKCCLPLQFAKLWRFLVTHIVYHKGI